MPIQNSSHYEGQTKQAEGTFGGPTPGESENARYLAAHQLIRAILGAGGVGALGGAAVGLGHMMAAPKIYTPEPSAQSVGIALPRERKHAKMAGVKEDLLAGSGPRSIADHITNFFAPHFLTQGTFWGEHASSPWEIPAFWTAAVPGIAAAGYGGYKATEGIMDHARKNELDSQLASTKKNYGKYVRHALANKQANDLSDVIERELDELVELCEKKANPDDPAAAPEPSASSKYTPSPVYHAANIAESLYFPAALAAALGAGKLSYDYFKKRSPENIAEEALRRRAKERAGGYAPIHMLPLPGGNPV